jgi:asparagine N-glycosylation enzyme membrane subunit Stt3
MKWYAYWAGIIAFLFGALYLKNAHRHQDKTCQWNLSKSAIECIMLVLATAFMPAILVVYGSMWLTKGIKRPAFRMGAGVAIGTILMMLVGWALEVLVLLGVFSINLISDDFLGYMKERQEKRGVSREVMA